MAFKGSLTELAGGVSVPNTAIANKLHELNIKRDLEVEYVCADGKPLVDEPIGLGFLENNNQDLVLDGSGKATLKNAPLGPFNAKQPKRS
jgi:hypothetical protein